MKITFRNNFTVNKLSTLKFKHEENLKILKKLANYRSKINQSLH